MEFYGDLSSLSAVYSVAIRSLKVGMTRFSEPGIIHAMKWWHAGI